MNFIKNKYNDYIDNICQTLGHGIGLEFRESILLINDKNEKIL